MSNIINLYKEYIKLLEKEVSRVGGLSIVKPYLKATPAVVAEGQRIRDGIKVAEELKPKVIVLCGSSKFVDIIAVTAWLLEKEEGVITMGMHTLPKWYFKDILDYPVEHGGHLAEHESVADQMDELHKRKIDLADEIFIINYLDYIGDSTMAEMTYASEKNIPARWFNPPPDKEQDPIAKKVQELINKATENK